MIWLILPDVLIQTKSISGTEGGVAKLYQDEMKKLGYDEVFQDAAGNVIGLIRGDEEGPTIMFNSHMDHVSEGDVANWEGYDPYGAEIDVCEVDNEEKTGTELAKCIHGRAASDTKGGGAVQIYSGAIILKLRELVIQSRERICLPVLFWKKRVNVRE